MTTLIIIIIKCKLNYKMKLIQIIKYRKNFLMNLKKVKTMPIK